MAENILEIRHLSKSFGSNEVLRDIDFTVEKGDVISIIGASGSGKSTLLRCINSSRRPLAGRFSITARTSPGAASTRRSTARMSGWCSSRSTSSTT